MGKDNKGRSMKAIVYSKAQCGYCDMAKNLLEQKGIEFEEKRIDSNVAILDELKEKVPSVRSVPQIFLDNEHVGGYNELRNKLQGE